MDNSNSNFAILWDVENVTPKAHPSFVENLFDHCQELGKFAFASAYGDWTRGELKKLGDILAEHTFDLVHVPKSGKNSADISLITQATEMVFQYPHIDTYIILTGDIDFRPLLLMLRKHGKKIHIICDGQTASEDLLAIADDYRDYRRFVGDYRRDSRGKGKGSHIYEMKKRNIAFQLLVQAIKVMESENKVPTLGSAKVRMKLLDDSFEEKELGYRQWKDFVLDAVDQEHIKMIEEEKYIRLTLP